MAMTRTPMTDDDGSGTTGTIINNAWKTELYNQIDAALAALLPSAWTDLPYGSVSWLANNGSWTVEAGDLSYLRYARLGSVVFMRGAILNTSILTGPTELRMLISPTIVISGKDAFGYLVWTNDGFSSQDVGQSIARATNGWIAFKKRDGGNWTASANTTSVIFNLVFEAVP